MTVKFCTTQEYYEGVVKPFLGEWRLQSTRDKLTQWWLASAWLQDTCGLKGHRRALGLPVIEVGDRDIAALFHDVNSQTKFRRLVKQYKLVKPDCSWVAANISGKDNPRRCNAWHFTHRDTLGKDLVWFEFDPYNAAHGPHVVMVDAILKADGAIIDEDFVFHGKWAVEDWKAGQLTWDELKEVYKTAMLCRFPGKEVDFRVYDAISLSAKSVRGRYICSVSDGQKIGEAVDFNAAALVCAEFASTVLFNTRTLGKGFGKLNQLCDERVLRRAWRLLKHPDEDAYRQIWEAAWSIDPNTGVLPQKWTASARKTIKSDVTIMLNYTTEQIAACRTAYLMNFRHVKVQQNKRRQWLLWMALKRVNSTAWLLAQACRMTGRSDLFFKAFTMGEKVLINNTQRYLADKGVKTVRVHDALWSANERVFKGDKSEQKKWSNKVIGLSIMNAFGVRTSEEFAVKCVRASNSHSVDGIKKLITGQLNRDALKDVVHALAALTDDQRRMLRMAMRDDKYYCEDSFPKQVDEALWTRKTA